MVDIDFPFREAGDAAESFREELGGWFVTALRALVIWEVFGDWRFGDLFFEEIDFVEE